jgi:peptide/nickel transport system permease protein
MFLPAITLALTLIGEYAMLMRSSLLEVFSEDFIVTARAKGLKERDVIRKHGYPNALLPVVTAISINLGLTIAGAVQVETVFSWPGIGRLMYDALNNRDYPLLQGIFLLVCICVVIANLLSDILYMALDPRVKS